MAFNHQPRIDAGLNFDRSQLPDHKTALVDLPLDTTDLRFRRVRSSHRGMHRFGKLNRLWLYSVNQEFLDELADIPTIEHLFIDGITATDLSPLARLRRLRRLVVIGGTKIDNLDWVVELPQLESLAIENFKRLRHLDALSSQMSLSALGVEGSIWTRMQVASLAPLSEMLGLRSLFLTNLTAVDRSLCHLHPLRNLQVLQIGALFPDEELVRLHKALPNLHCDWFEMIKLHGSTREGIRAAAREHLRLAKRESHVDKLP